MLLVGQDEGHLASGEPYLPMSKENGMKSFRPVPQGHPVHFGALNANSSKTAEGTNFKFGRHVLRYSPDMSLTNISQGTNFKFHRQCPMIYPKTYLTTKVTMSCRK